MKHTIQLKNYRNSLILLLISIAFVIFFSQPFFGDPFSGDNAMFQTIGKYWAQGSIPYVELWDSKGPIIFFINALGYMITKNIWGIIILQILSLTLSLVYINKMYKFVSDKYALLLTLFTVVAMIPMYASNSVEEFTLPLLCISFYYILQYLNDYYKSKYTHNPHISILYGITFSFCLLTRLTDAVGLCVSIFIIAIVLIIRNEWYNLFHNIFFFIIGALILLVPFVLYFYMNGAINDLIYGTLLYNIDYATNSVDLSGGESFLEILICYSPSVILSIVGFIKILIENKKVPGVILFLTGLFTSYWLFKSNGYLHYGLIVLPYICMIANECKRLYFERKSVVYYKLSNIYLCVLCIFGLYYSLNTLKEYYNYIYVKESKLCNAVQSEMIQIIPKDELTSFVAYNTNTGFYLQHNIKPYYNLFTFQDWAASRSLVHEKKTIDTYENGDVKWIFIEGDYQNTYIKNIIEKNYILMDAKNKPLTEIKYYLYKRK